MTKQEWRSAMVKVLQRIANSYSHLKDGEARYRLTNDEFKMMSLDPDAYLTAVQKRNARYPRMANNVKIYKLTAGKWKRIHPSQKWMRAFQ